MLECRFLIIGAGETGLFLAKELAKSGYDIILIDQTNIGGSALFTLDYPKSLLAEEAANFSQALKLFKTSPTTFSVLLKHRQKIQQKINESIVITQEKLENSIAELGQVQVVRGKAEFISKSLVEVTSETHRHLITFKDCLIAVGKNEIVPSKVEGIEKFPFLFQHNIFLFRDTPTKLGIIGCTLENLEVASIYADLGVKVEIYDKNNSQACFKNLDKTAVNYLLKKLLLKQVEFFFKTKIVKVEKKRGSNTIKLKEESGSSFEVSHIYQSLAETFDGSELCLSKVSVKYDKKGIITDKFGRTSQPGIWAFGEANNSVTPHNKKSMLLDFVDRNRTLKSDKKPIPWVNEAVVKNMDYHVRPFNFTISKISGSAPVLFLGITETEAIAKFGPQIKVKMWQNENVEGFIKFIYKDNLDQLVSIVAAGEMSKRLEGLALMALQKNISLKDVLNILNSYQW